MFAETTFTPLWVERLDENSYHSDRTAVNSSSLKLILKSPATFHAKFFQGQLTQPPTASMKFGTLAHKLILEGPEFLERHVVMPNLGDMRSSKNREARDAWLAEHEGQIIVTEDEKSRLEGMLNSIIRHGEAFSLLRGGKTEISGYYADDITRLRCRVRLDFLSLDSTVLVDLKTTLDCARSRFSRSIWKYRYDMQMAMYCRAVKAISGRPVDFPVYIAIEKEPPFECAVYVADPSVLEVGERDHRVALDRLAECLKSDHWPIYQKQVQNIGLPHFALRDQEDY